MHHIIHHLLEFTRRLAACAPIWAACGTLLFAATPSPAEERALTDQQLAALLEPSAKDCASPAKQIPASETREFPIDRITKTLHGVWLKQAQADDKAAGIAYFWVVDMKRNEAVIFALSTRQPPLDAPITRPRQPKFTYMMCVQGEGAAGQPSAQIEEFVKISDDPEEAPLAKALKAKNGAVTLGGLWQELVATKYFEGLPTLPVAGASLKPVQIERVPVAAGAAQVSFRWNGEYRGGGETALKAAGGIAMQGLEHAQFVGLTAPAGDFLISSRANGKPWQMEATAGESFNLTFDTVILGPLQ